MIRTIAIVAFLSACGPRDKNTTDQPIADLQARRDAYMAQVSDKVFTERCDKLTFKAMLSAFGKTQKLGRFEPVLGEWHRDTAPCYPADSKSEISFDGLLMVLHDAVTQDDPLVVDRMLSYGIDHEWVMGAGQHDIVYMPQLEYFSRKVKRDAFLIPSIPSLSGFRAHLVAMAIYLIGRVDGKISDIHFRLLRKLSADHSENPLFAALLARYTDGDQSEAIAILNRDYPTDDLPSGVSKYGWGSCPDSVFFAATIAVMEGK